MVTSTDKVEGARNGGVIVAGHTSHSRTTHGRPVHSESGRGTDLAPTQTQIPGPPPPAPTIGQTDSDGFSDAMLTARPRIKPVRHKSRQTNGGWRPDIADIVDTRSDIVDRRIDIVDRRPDIGDRRSDIGNRRTDI